MASQQNKIVASFSSGRGNTLPIPLPDEEIKGTGSRFIDVSFAQRVAESLNTIFKNKFKITYDVFCVEELELLEPLNLKPEARIFSPMTWKHRSINNLIINSDIYLSLNEGFNWGLDDITKAFYEFHTEKNAIRATIINVNNKEVLDAGGGKIHDFKNVFLYDQYIKPGIGIIPNKKRNPFFKDQGGHSKWTLGGTYIHEVMYHLYPSDFGQGQTSTNYLRRYFLLEENSNGYESYHSKGENQWKLQFWIDVRERNLKTIWKKSNQ